MSDLRVAKLRTFFVGESLWDVTMDLPPDILQSDLPIVYTVDWNGTTKLVFNAPRVGLHREVLLAALDHLQACGELDEDTMTTPVNQIMEV
jgi:hypothetical protein